MTRMYCEDIRNSHVTEVEVAGWIHDIRNLGGIAFILLRDRTGIMQITLLKKQNRELFRTLTKLNRESVIRVRGEVQRDEKVMNGFEIIPKEGEVLSRAEAPLPLGVADNVEAELDTRLDNRFLDLRKEAVRDIFRLRAVLLSSARAYLEEKGFIEVHTPKIVAAATEGGTELFPLRYFTRNAYLNQSPQLYKQILMATGFDRVYEIGPAFRAEAHDTVRHLNEFTSIDVEMAFSDYQEAMTLLENIIRNGYETIKSRAPELMEKEHLNLPEKVEAFPRVSYTEAVEIAQKKGLEIEWGEDLSMEATRLIAQEFPDFWYQLLQDQLQLFEPFQSDI